MDSTFLNNLLSGALGAMLGALASVFALIITNAHTRSENTKVLDAQAIQFAVERQNFERQLQGDRDLGRESRELDAIAAILTLLSDDFDRDPLSQEVGRRLSSLCMLLWLNVAPAVGEGWTAVTTRKVPSSRQLSRHPLAAALVSRAAAISLAAVFPNTGIRHGEDSSRPILSVATSDSVAALRQSVAAIGREMLSWPLLTDSEKIKFFDEFVAEATTTSSETLTLANVLLGGHSKCTVVFDLHAQPRLSELIDRVSELGSAVDPRYSEFGRVILEPYVVEETLPVAPQVRRDLRLTEVDDDVVAVGYHAAGFLDFDRYVDAAADQSHEKLLRGHEWSNFEGSGLDESDYRRKRREDE